MTFVRCTVTLIFSFNPIDFTKSHTYQWNCILRFICPKKETKNKKFKGKYIVCIEMSKSFFFFRSPLLLFCSFVFYDLSLSLIRSHTIAHWHNWIRPTESNKTLGCVRLCPRRIRSANSELRFYDTNQLN